MKPKNNFGSVYIKLRPKTATSSLAFIQTTFKNLFPLTPYHYSFKQDENIKDYDAEAKWKQIMLFGAILTIFISCIGLFGLSVLSAEKRIKEIGIRKVLGASVSSVVTSLSKDFLKLVILSIVYCATGCLDRCGQMARALSLPDSSKLVDVFVGSRFGNMYCIGDSEFPGNKSSKGKSCEEFEE